MIYQFIRRTNLDDSLLVGYYGGGNFGDELLLETLLCMLGSNHVTGTKIYYLNPDWYPSYHKDFGGQVVSAKKLLGSIRAFLKAKNIIVGGGGLWGLDMNLKVLFLSLSLLFARVILRKRVYLVGVGYYSSTNLMGNFGAWCAGKAANHIYTRDKESYGRFLHVNKSVSADKDLSYYLNTIDKNLYKNQVEELGRSLPIEKKGKTILITVRQFSDASNEHYKKTIRTVVENNPNKKIILAILEPREINPEGYAFITKLVSKNSNAISWDFRCNPIAFYFFMGSRRNNLIMLTPHYHGLAVALQNKIPFLPLIYDNKSAQLLEDYGLRDRKSVADLTAAEAQAFIDGAYRR